MVSGVGCGRAQGLPQAFARCVGQSAGPGFRDLYRMFLRGLAQKPQLPAIPPAPTAKRQMQQQPRSAEPTQPAVERIRLQATGVAARRPKYPPAALRLMIQAMLVSGIHYVTPRFNNSVV